MVENSRVTNPGVTARRAGARRRLGSMLVCVVAYLLPAGLAGLAGFAGLAVLAGNASADERPELNGAVFAIGDSVMLGARPCLQQRGYVVDAQGSRQVLAGAQTLAAMNSLPRWVVTHFGTNGGLDDSGLDAVMEVLGSQRHVIMMTVQLPDGTDRYTFEARTNDAIRRMPARYPNVQVVDWNKASSTHPEWTWADGIHLTPSGCKAFAALLEPAVRRPLATVGLPGTAWRFG